MEIDEAMFGKSKYNRGTYRKGIWVLGLVTKSPLILHELAQRGNFITKFLVVFAAKLESVLLYPVREIAGRLTSSSPSYSSSSYLVPLFILMVGVPIPLFVKMASTPMVL